MEKLQKLTKTDFETFKKECNKWINKFGLYDWDMKYQFVEMDDSAGRCVTNYVASAATIVLNPNFSNSLVDKATHIKEIALHEVLEVMLSPLTALIGERSYDEGEAEHQKHRIIQRLMKFLKE